MSFPFWPSECLPEMRGGTALWFFLGMFIFFQKVLSAHIWHSSSGFDWLWHRHFGCGVGGKGDSISGWVGEAGPADSAGVWNTLCRSCKKAVKSGQLKPQRRLLPNCALRKYPSFVQREDCVLLLLICVYVCICRPIMPWCECGAQRFQG